MELRRNSSRTGRLAPASAVVWRGAPVLHTPYTVHSLSMVHAAGVRKSLPESLIVRRALSEEAFFASY